MKKRQKKKTSKKQKRMDFETSQTPWPSFEKESEEKKDDQEAESQAKD